MPAPASLTPPSSPAAIAQLLSAGNGQDVLNSDASGVGQFAAHFAHLIGKQLAVQVENGALPAAASPKAEPGVIETQPEEQLEALLPFIEALGLAQEVNETDANLPATPVTSTNGQEGTELATTDPSVIPLAAPITAINNPLARNAMSNDIDVPVRMPESNVMLAHAEAPVRGTDSMINGSATMSSYFNSLTEPLTSTITDYQFPSIAAHITFPASSAINATAISAATTAFASKSGLVLGHGMVQPSQTAQPGQSVFAEGFQLPPVDPVASTEVLSDGREFSSQLVAAIATSKEERAPGSVAEAVHQVIASSSPAQVKSTNSIDQAVAQPVGSVEWSEEIGNRIAWMAGRSESRAELVLTPPQMGRIEINLSIKGDQAAASFVSANPVVREALEAALPRLREVLADVGIQLGQAQVSAENAQQWAQQEKHGDNSGSDRDRGPVANAAISPISSGSLSTATTLKGGRSLVDVFA